MKKIIAALFLLIFAQVGFSQNAAGVVSGHTTEKELVQRLAGPWALVSIESVDAAGAVERPYGNSPQGRLIFDTNGNYSIQIYRAGRAEIAAGDKTKATPDEYKELALSSNTHFGRYKVDAEAGTITYFVEQAFFPNWSGKGLKSVLELNGDELKHSVSRTSDGAVFQIAIWKRLQSR